MTNCYHCGDECQNELIKSEEKVFCCNGCKTVFELLKEHAMGDYYDMESAPGLKVNGTTDNSKFNYLDEAEISAKFLLFNDGTTAKVSFFIPQIHCSSCIWVLENLNQLHTAFTHSHVLFSKRTLDLSYKPEEIALSEVVALLASIGYEPDLSENIRERKSKTNQKLLLQIGVAGFAFGNIMLLSFPEYLGIDRSFQEFRAFFGYISLFLAIPTFFFSGSDYLKQAWRGIKQRFINMDIPIAVGMCVLLVRSAYEILSQTGAGYLDSLAGLVFFLLLGKWFQRKSYDALSFERDYKSYFPIAVNRIHQEHIEIVEIANLNVADRIILRNQELVPADGILDSDEALIDYSFVTGEADPIFRKRGEQIYAGGRLMGSSIELILSQKVDNSYLTQLWNEQVFKEKSGADLNDISNKVSKYFSVAIFTITIFTAIYWQINNPSIMWHAISSVLIVACPCALALSLPFTLGNITRLHGHFGLYLKNAEVLEQLAKVDTLVFDKTGTITTKTEDSLSYDGISLNQHEINALASAVNHSMHPISIAIKAHLGKTQSAVLSSTFHEDLGQGIRATGEDFDIKLGKAIYVGLLTTPQNGNGSEAHLQINGQYKGYFCLKQDFRPGLKSLLNELSGKYELHLLSGDNDHQKSLFEKEFSFKSLQFNQQPKDKLNYVYELQKAGKAVLMIGDGLNDAGALKQSDVGLAIADDLHQFSPACSAILKSEKLHLLDEFLKSSKTGIRIVYWSFFLSFCYNVVGLYFAVTGQLSPVLAAILMPLSSISVVFFASKMSRKFASINKN
ncbi:MAG: heavy metal translocating P-type ATPase metal-binding domain-containing protein [Flavobacteriaceae bacterium]|nr:heavy metal translocating P-type ATPase metal-binding domain-containing protein [Flavobacteriaceae bacterium]